MGWLLRRSDPGDVRSRGRRSPDRRARRFSPHAEALEQRQVLSTWQHFELAPAVSAGGRITAVSRIPGSMEVWWVGPNGSVQDANYYDGSGWHRFQLAPAGSASPNGPITAVSRIPGSMEVWWSVRTSRCRMPTITTGQGGGGSSWPRP